VDVFLKVPVLRGTGADQFRVFLRARAFRQVSIDLDLEFGISEEFTYVGAEDFSFPRTQRAAYEVACIDHDFLYLDRTLGVLWLARGKASPYPIRRWSRVAGSDSYHRGW
jgi:hypothetical protein